MLNVIAATLCSIAFTLPDGSVLIEAEDFQVDAGWTISMARAEAAPGALSGEQVLNSNDPSSRARATVQLAEGKWVVWVRAFDWAGAPGRYGFTVSIDDDSRRAAVTEPLTPAFVWENWGLLDGGNHEIILSDPDAFNAAIDCIALVPDLAFVPTQGPALTLVEASVAGAFVSEASTLHLQVQSDAPVDADSLTLGLARMSADGGITEYVWHEEYPMPDSWTADQTLNLTDLALPPFPYLWPGDYALHAAVHGTSWTAGSPVIEVTKNAGSLPAPVKAEILPSRGVPALFVNDKLEFPFAYLVHSEERQPHYREMAQTGIRFFSMGAPIGNGQAGFDSTNLDAPFLEILREQPDALMFPRIGVTPPQWWLDQHPDERVVFDDGTRGPQSMFSDLWLEDAVQWVEAYARYIRSSPYADHVLGIHICSGYTAEWQSWGLWDDLRGDFSPAAQRAWRAYLGRKYETDEALSAAWQQDVTFANAALPTRARRETDTGMFRMPGEHQDIIDFYDFYWRGTVNAIEQLAAAAKRGGGEDWLVGFFYGYEIQYGGKAQESQHLGMAQLLACPDIDFFCSPAMYSLREPGGTSTFMSFTQSVQSHGKLWWDEADNRTHLAVDNPVAPAADLFESLNVLEREFAHAYTQRAGIWWFDMQGGWYADKTIRSLLRQMREYGERVESGTPWTPPREIAFFIDDKSTYRLAPESAYLNAGLPQFLSAMPRLGVPYDTLLLSDILEVPEYKVYVFLMAFDLADEERAAIQSLMRDGHTLVFLGKTGIGRYNYGRITHDEAQFEALLGAKPSGTRWYRAEYDDYTIVYSPFPNPTTSELRDIARDSGVHIYSETDDACYIGNGMVALHAQTTGEKVLSFPIEVTAQEIFVEDGETVAGQEMRLTFQAKETRMFHIANVKSTD